MTSDHEALVQRRLRRAHESLAAAELLAQAGHWHACVNRLYYACFYAVGALLARHNLSAGKHSGVRALFNRHFVKQSIVSRDLGQFYHDLFVNRQQGDYDDFSAFDAARVHPWLEQTPLFIARIEELLNTAGSERTSL